MPLTLALHHAEPTPEGMRSACGFLDSIGAGVPFWGSVDWAAVTCRLCRRVEGRRGGGAAMSLSQCIAAIERVFREVLL